MQSAQTAALWISVILVWSPGRQFSGATLTPSVRSHVQLNVQFELEKEIYLPTSKMPQKFLSNFKYLSGRRHWSVCTVFKFDSFKITNIVYFNFVFFLFYVLCPFWSFSHPRNVIIQQFLDKFDRCIQYFCCIKLIISQNFYKKIHVHFFTAITSIISHLRNVCFINFFFLEKTLWYVICDQLIS